MNNYLVVVEHKNVGMLDFTQIDPKTQLEGEGGRGAIKELEEHSCLQAEKDILYNIDVIYL